ITNLKRSKKFGSPQNARARIAINRIELLQTSGRLQITGVLDNARRDAYADPWLVRLVVRAVDENRAVVLLSDDRELRVRLRQRLQDRNAENWEIVGLDEIAHDLHVFFAAEQVTPVNGKTTLQFPSDAQRNTWRNGAKQLSMNGIG